MRFHPVLNPEELNIYCVEETFMEMTAISDEMIDYIEGLPKAELHVHLEGTIVAETVLKLAARNGMDYPFKTLEEIHEALDKRTAGLVSFLDLHYLFVSVLKTRNDFYEVTYEFLRTCKANMRARHSHP